VLVVPIVKVEEAEPPAPNETLEGFSATVGPAGETVDDRMTVPMKPFRLTKVMVDFPEEP
jgi:hypothetical protein